VERIREVTPIQAQLDVMYTLGLCPFCSRPAPPYPWFINNRGERHCGCLYGERVIRVMTDGTREVYNVG
jgi:hypothetical protein